MAVLRDGFARVRVDYEPLPDGARLIYETADADLVAGIHAWFDAQTMDHG
ncbi:MAG TPA: hypothetical protein VEZ46_12240 [Mycobacteriales bacterium]|nr:hypothetical protein [Mycobacteriales bacterium]